jgi:hypothetical protein
METTTYTLPAYWASALFNGDLSGLEESEEEALMLLIVGEQLPDPIGIVGDDDEYGPESFFCTYHDARPYGVLACDCLEYIFPA